MALSEEEMKRYSRHLVIPEMGMEGQERIKKAKVLVVGAGGLGSPVCLYLAAAGVGEIGIADFDIVEYSNLHRQVIHTEKDVGKEKVVSAKEAIVNINSNVKVNIHKTKTNPDNAAETIKDYGIVIDGTDNFDAKYIINDTCAALGKPWIYGSALGFDGQVSVFHGRPCYRCLYPTPPKEECSCEENGVLGIVPGIIGCIQAAEAIKLILGKGKLLTGRLLVFDAMKMEFKELLFSAKKNCPVCGGGKEIPTQNTNNRLNPNMQEAEITPQELKQEMDEGTVFLLDVREPFEYKICHIKGAKLMPIEELEKRINELDKDKNIVVYCHYNKRGMTAALFMKLKGFKKVRSLKGGIAAWAKTIDKEMTRY